MCDNAAIKRCPAQYRKKKKKTWSSSSDHFNTDEVVPPSDHCCIETAAPSSDHYGIDIVVPSSDHCYAETVPPSSDYCTKKVAMYTFLNRNFPGVMGLIGNLTPISPFAIKIIENSAGETSPSVSLSFAKAPHLTCDCLCPRHPGSAVRVPKSTI